jgi:hypothetical protein
MSSFDVLWLRSLIASTQEENKCLIVLRVIHPITGAVVDPQLAHAFSDPLPVAQESGLQAVEPRHDARPGRGIPESREPLSHGRLAVDILVLTNLHEHIVA